MWWCRRPKQPATKDRASRTHTYTEASKSIEGKASNASKAGLQKQRGAWKVQQSSFVFLSSAQGISEGVQKFLFCQGKFFLSCGRATLDALVGLDRLCRGFCGCAAFFFLASLFSEILWSSRGLLLRPMDISLSSHSLAFVLFFSPPPAVLAHGRRGWILPYVLKLKLKS